jgi:hypothetical protein
MFASNATVSKLYGNRRGISVGLSQDALCRDCSMLIAINRMRTVSQDYQAADELFRRSRTSMACTYGISPVCLVHLVSLVHLVYPVSLVQPNKQDKPNKRDRPNRPNEQDRTSGALRPQDYLQPGSRSNPPQLGIPSSEGIGTYLYTVIPDSLTTRKGLAGCGKTISARENVDGPHVRHNGRTSHRMLKRLFSKAAANYHFIRGGWDDPNCARPTRAF